MATKTERLLDKLNAARGLSYPEIGFAYFADIRGDGFGRRSVYQIFNEAGGVIYSSLNGKTPRETCDRIRVALIHARRARFFVSFEIVTPQSAEHGDVESRGFISPGLGALPSAERPEACGLRRAVEIWRQTRTRHCDGVEAIEADCSDATAARYVTIYNGREYLTGATESRSLHIPETVSAASRARLVRLLSN
jgi:hypothetical protein